MKDDWPPWLPIAVLAGFAGLLAAGVVQQTGRPALADAVAAVVVPLAWLAWARGWFGSVVLAPIVIAAVGVVGWANSGNIVWFALVLLAGQTAITSPPWEAVTVTAAAEALLAVQWVRYGESQGWGAWMIGVLFAATASSAGQRQRQLLADLQAAQDELAERATAAERQRIAHELHDVIAHSLTVTMLHITAARLAVEHEPERAADALAEAERLGRQSLAEVRRTVGLLSDSGGGDGPAAPLPSAADLPTLADEYRGAGLEVTLHVDGNLADVPPTCGLAIYRIVQESLANAARHAPGAPVSIRVVSGVDGPTVRVVNGMPARPPAGRGSGLGIRGMRERAEALGGRLDAGPSEAGWAVEAWLPA